MLGERIADLALPSGHEGVGFGEHVSVKEAVLPFDRFDGADSLLGPEMRSTGEVMGIARDFPTAFAKAQAAAGLAAANAGHGLHHRHRLRQAGRLRGRPDFARQRLSDSRHRAVRLRQSRAWGAGQDDQQDRRGLAARRRLDRARRGEPDRRHAHRLGRTQRRLGVSSPRDRPRHPVPDDTLGWRLRRPRDRPAIKATGARRALTTGAAQPARQLQ